MILINSSTRQFNIPGADLVFGVTGDAGSAVKEFSCPRYVGNNLDLTGCFIRMNYRNANGEVDSYLVPEVAVDGDNIVFGWELTPKVTMYKGNISFVMCVTGPDTKVKWHTTLGRGQVLEGLEPDSDLIENGTADVVATLITMVEAQTEAVENKGAEWVRNVQLEGTDQISAVQSAGETAKNGAVAQIEAKGASTLATIPEDYTTVQNAVRGAANAIRGKASGSVIRVDDVSPMEHYPTVKVHGKNILPYPYKQTTATASGGTFTAQPDGGVLVSGVPTDYTSLNLYQDIPLAKSGNIILSFSGDFVNVNISMVIYDVNDAVLFTKETWRGASPISVNLDLYPTATRWLVFLKRGTPNIEMSGVVYPQMEFGDTATAYTPYIDPTTITVRRCGKNVLDLPKVMANSNGVTFKPSDGGYIEVSGTPTGVSSRQIYKGVPLLKTGYVTFSLSGNYTNIVPDLQLLDADNNILKQVQSGTSVTLDLDNYPGTAYWYIAIKRAENNVAVTGNVYLQLEPGMTATAWEKYEGETQIPSVDGTVSGLTAVSPTMTLMTDKAGVNIECEYSRDTNKVIAEILEKITALGG